MKRGVYLNMGKAKLRNANKRLICRLNNLCFGMHGHLTTLLKDFHYFFYFKKHQKYKIAHLYLQSIACQLKHIIVLSRLIENLGGYTEIFDYKNNQVDYYILKDNLQVFENVAILDSITNQTLLLEEYLKVKSTILDKKIEEIIDEEIANIKNSIEKLTDKMVKTPN